MWIDARLALWLARPRALVVADLHWGYVESHRAQGNLLPAWGDADIASRLAGLIADYAPREVIWLGDSLHALAGKSAAEDFLAHATVPITVVTGNHDARWNRASAEPVVIREDYLLHHGDQQRAVPDGMIEIVGHFHPAASLHDGAGMRLKLPALVLSPRRWILPAFSPWAAGTAWRQTDVDESVYAIGTKRIFTVAGRDLQKEPLLP